VNTIVETTIEADPKVPVIRMSRDFNGTPEQLFRAHTDPALFAQWVGPSAMETRVVEVGCAPVATGGSCPPATAKTGSRLLHGSRPDRIVQTFTFEGQPDGWRWSAVVRGPRQQAFPSTHTVPCG
jgi:uncharacterized protein YndB with AHSA1/START domain